MKTDANKALRNSRHHRMLANGALLLLIARKNNITSKWTKESSPTFSNHLQRHFLLKIDANKRMLLLIYIIIMNNVIIIIPSRSEQHLMTVLLLINFALFSGSHQMTFKAIVKVRSRLLHKKSIFYIKRRKGCWTSSARVSTNGHEKRTFMCVVNGTHHGKKP